MIYHKVVHLDSHFVVSFPCPCGVFTCDFNHNIMEILYNIIGMHSASCRVRFFMAHNVTWYVKHAYVFSKRERVKSAPLSK